MPEKHVQAEEKNGGKKILIVEDEKPLAHALELKMKHEGFDAIAAGSGKEGLDLVEKQSFDMILLELIMPVIEGFTFLQNLQATKVKTPVIVLSNLGQDEDRAKAKALGALDYFVKANTPIADIVRRVKDVLQ